MNKYWNPENAHLVDTDLGVRRRRNAQCLQISLVDPRTMVLIQIIPVEIGHCAAHGDTEFPMSHGKRLAERPKLVFKPVRVDGNHVFDVLTRRDVCADFSLGFPYD